MKVYFDLLTETAIRPRASTGEAACLDLFIDRIEMDGRNRATVYYGIRSKIPPFYKGVIVPRSSFTHKGWIMANSPGQIDSDYRGEWMSKFEAIPDGILDQSGGTPILTYPPFPYKIGDRATQVYFSKVVETLITFKQVEIDTERGENGFGSTDHTLEHD